MKNIAIFASGAGSNAKKIISYFKESQDIKVALVVSNNSHAGVLTIANENEIPSLIINKTTIIDQHFVMDILQKFQIDYIVLAGYMILIPRYLAAKFSNKILNIHPALLPNYGGKGMYGHHVHHAVFNNHEQKSGISIHFVNEHYDEGQIIFQKSVDIADCINAEEIGKAVLKLEHDYYAKVIEAVILKTALPH